MGSLITVTVKVMGQPAKVLENFSGESVSDVLAFLSLTGNYTVNIGGQPASNESLLSEGAYIVLAPSVKGAAKVAKKTSKRTISANPNKAPLKKKTVKKTVAKK